MCRNETRSREIKSCKDLANDFMSGGLKYSSDMKLAESFFSHNPCKQKLEIKLSVNSLFCESLPDPRVKIFFAAFEDCLQPDLDLTATCFCADKINATNIVSIQVNVLETVNIYIGKIEEGILLIHLTLYIGPII